MHVMDSCAQFPTFNTFIVNKYTIRVLEVHYLLFFSLNTLLALQNVVEFGIKQMLLFQSLMVYSVSVHAFSGNQTHDLGVASTNV